MQTLNITFLIRQKPIDRSKPVPSDSTTWMKRRPTTDVKSSFLHQINRSKQFLIEPTIISERYRLTCPPSLLVKPLILSNFFQVFLWAVTTAPKENWMAIRGRKSRDVYWAPGGKFKSCVCGEWVTPRSRYQLLYLKLILFIKTNI